MVGLLVELQSTPGRRPRIMQMGHWLSQPVLSDVANCKMGELIVPTSKGGKEKEMSQYKEST